MGDDRASSAFDFKAMVEHMPVMVWTAKPNGALDYVCPKVMAYFGRTFEQMIAWGWAEVVHPEDLPNVGEHWSNSLETGKPYDIPFRIRRASDGSYRMHLTRALPQRGSAGEIIRWCGTTCDIDHLVPR